MFDTLYSGETVEIDIVQGEDFEQNYYKKSRPVMRRPPFLEVQKCLLKNGSRRRR